MDLRAKLLLLVGGGLILIAFLLLVAVPLFRSDTTDTEALDALPQLVSPSELTPLPADNTTTPIRNSQSQILEQTESGEENQAMMAENSQKAEIERVTRLFAERFGSYSNYSNFSNIDSLQSFSTESMKTYLENTKQSAVVESGYYGVTTRVLRVVLEDFVSQSTATMNISVQQEVQDGLNAEIVKTIRDGRVELVYQNGSWLVNGIFYTN